MFSLQMPEARLALRRLRRQPGATFAAIVTLATAFAAALATWILIDSVLLTPVPAAHEPERLMVVQERQLLPDGTLGQSYTALTFDRLDVIRSRPAFSSVTAIGHYPALVGRDTRPISREIALITANFFGTVGVSIAAGRDLTPDDDREGAPLAVLLAHSFWESEYRRDLSALGSTLRVGDATATIVGIASPLFRGVALGNAPALFMPARTAYDVLGRNFDFLAVGMPQASPVAMFQIIGRVPTTRSPQAAVSMIGEHTYERRRTVRVTYGAQPLAEAALPEAARPNMERFTRLLATTVGMLLLIGILSVGLLVLIRSESRREELAMCLALGASRMRLIRGVLAESAWLSVAGLALAVPLTSFLLAAARTYELPGRISVDWLAMAVDLDVVLLAAAVVVMATTLIGLMAAGVGLGGQVADVLRARAGATPRLSRRRTRQALIVAQVAVAMVLLVGTGLFARSVAAALRLNSAFAPAEVVTTNLSVRGFGYAPDETSRFFQQVRDNVGALPGIQSAALRSSPGSMNPGGTVTFNGEGRQLPSEMRFVYVDEHFFSTIGMPILHGRDFQPSDTATSELVGIVSESLGRFVSRGGDPLGMTVRETSRPINQPFAEVRIVGVVPDLVVRTYALEPLALYYTVRQKPAAPSHELLVRSQLRSGLVGTEIRNVIERLDPRIAPSAFETLEDAMAKQMAPQQFGAAVLGALATVALLLTLLGTYVIAETMAKARERELGVRAALGATARHLGGLILTESIVLIGLGLVGGLGLTWLAASTVEALLYQTEPFDLTAIGLATVAILGLALLVSARPALRASRVDIAGLLRE
jgi:predicted permease